MTASKLPDRDEMRIQIQKRITELEKANQDLRNEILERKQEKHKINRYNSVLEGINRIFGSIVKAETEEELGNKCLSIALEVTGSQIGFVGEVGADRLLHDIAISDMGWNQCCMYNKTGHRRPAGYYILRGLCSYVVNSGKGFFTNNLQLDPHSIGLPKGHPPLTSFLSVPLVLDGKIIGILAVANRENGYSLEQQEDLETFAPAVMQAFQKKREEKEKQKAEEVLREGEEKYKALFENSLDAILFAFPEGTIYAANPAACQMFGMTEEEIIRSGRSGIIDISDPRLKPALEERARTGSFKGEFNYRRKDGTIFPGDMSSTIFKDKSGILRTVIIIRDITKRKQVEEALKHSEKQYRTLGDTIPYGVWLTDAAGYCTYVSNSFIELVGMSMEQVQKFGWLHLLPPEDVQPTKDHWLHCIQTGEDFEREHRFKAKNGSYRNVLALGRPIKNEEGKITEWVGFNLDITERKQIEDDLKRARDSLEEKVKERTVELDKSYKSLKESEERLAEAQRIAHIGSWERDFASNEFHWSDEMYRMFGLKPQELKVHYDTFLNFVHPDDRHCIDNAVKEALDRRPLDVNFRIILANGEERIVHAKGEVVFDEKNNPVSIRGATKDITEHKKAEEALKNLEIMRKKEIHHRIKNNLQVISSLLDLQAGKFKDRGCIQDSEILEAFKESQDRVVSIALIHEELHESGRKDALNFSLYLKRLVESLFQSYSLGDSNISLSMSLKKNIFFGMDTAVPLGMIVNELVSNSLKHAFPDRDEGGIDIKLFENELSYNKGELSGKVTRYTLIASDNGIGIAENIDFENPDTLGLQLVNILVDQLDGEIKLKRDKGTQFIISFSAEEKDN